MNIYKTLKLCCIILTSLSIINQTMGMDIVIGLTPNGSINTNPSDTVLNMNKIPSNNLSDNPSDFEKVNFSNYSAVGEFDIPTLEKKKIDNIEVDEDINIYEDIPGFTDDFFRVTYRMSLICQTPISIFTWILTITGLTVTVFGAALGLSEVISQNVPTNTTNTSSTSQNSTNSSIPIVIAVGVFFMAVGALLDKVISSFELLREKNKDILISGIKEERGRTGKSMIEKMVKEELKNREAAKNTELLKKLNQKGQVQEEKGQVQEEESNDISKGSARQMIRKEIRDQSAKAL